MATLPDLKRLEFAGLPIPYSKIRVVGGLRHYVHEYPHVAGGSLEKLGRKLYEVTATCHFDALSLSGRYSLMWPDGINAFRALFEKGQTSPLVIPWIGSIDACAVEWGEDFDVKVISGEGVEVKWIEDQESEFLLDSVLPFKSSGGFAAKVEAFEYRIDYLEIDPPVGILESIRKVANDVIAVRDTAELYTSLVDAKLNELLNLIREADKTVALLNDPMNHQLLEDLHELWSATQELVNDIAQLDQVMDTYLTPRVMRIDEIAQAIYQAGDRAYELMQLNALEDPFAVPANTTIRYYKAA